MTAVKNQLYWWQRWDIRYIGGSGGILNATLKIDPYDLHNLQIN